MPLLITKGAVLFAVSLWGMQMQASETVRDIQASDIVRLSSNETYAEDASDGDKQSQDVHETSDTNLRISEIALKAGIDYCDYHNESFRCEKKSEEGKEVWTRGRRLGGGTFGVVYAARADIVEGALKMAAHNENPAYRQQNCKSIVDEMENLDKMVVALSDMGEYQAKSMCKDYLMHFIDTTPCFVHASKVDPVMGFVMNRMSGDLTAYHKWAREGKLSPEETLKCMKVVIREVIEGLRCMHMAGWAHLDIKGGNILLEWDRRAAKCPTEVRLTDFGDAAEINKWKKGKDLAFAKSAFYTPLAMYSVNGFVVSGKLDWCMFAYMFRDYPDSWVKDQWDDYWGGDCGHFGPEGRPTQVVLTKPILPSRSRLASVKMFSWSLFNLLVILSM